MATVDLKTISHLLNTSGIPSVTAEDDAESSLPQEDGGRWEEISAQLQGWKKSPGYEDEDGYIAPSTTAISSTETLLEALRKAGVTAPTRVVVNGDGGIVVKFREGESSKSVFEIEEDGEIELRRYKNNRVASQAEITL